MRFPWTKISTILFFLLLLSSSLAADKHRKLIGDSWVQVEPLMKESPKKLLSSDKISIANDYGSYDPSPTLDKPSFKQIPN